MATFTVTTLVDENSPGATVAAPGGAGLSLREAIELAQSGDTITFEASLAGGEIDLALGQLEIEKPFPFTTAPLVIDGDLDNDKRPDITVDAQGLSRVFEIAPDASTGVVNPNTAVVIDGLVITGGRASQGAGIDARSTAIEVRNSAVVDNEATFSGGGIAINNQFGGPIVTQNAIVNSTISNNTASDSAGIIFRRAELTIVNSVVNDNEATNGFAGGIRGFDARPLAIINSTVSGNSVTGSNNDDRVGGIRIVSVVESAPITLENATVTGNTAAGGSGTLTGGVRAIAEPLIVRNSIITGNAAAGLVSDVGSTITESNGANIFGQASVAGSVAGDLTGVPAEDVFADVAPIGTTGRLTGPIIFAGVLADNGGLTETVALDQSGPAVDGGNPITLLDPGPDRVIGTADDLTIFTDQRGPGFLRTVGGDIDVGAFEREEPPVIFTDGAEFVDLNDFFLADFANSTDALGGDDTVRLSETENLGVLFIAGAGDDTVEGSTSDDLINGVFGDDTLNGGSGFDTLFGGDGDDTLFGGAQGDILIGNAGDDLLVGGTFDDVLEGRVGNDFLFGGSGVDILFGGLGRDINVGGGSGDEFHFKQVDDSPAGFATRDVIQGFDGIGNAPGDLIDLTAIDAIAGGGENTFSFIGTAGFSGLGQLRVFNQAGNTIVAANVSGGLAADFEIEVDDGGIGAGAWRAADFVL